MSLCCGGGLRCPRRSKVIRAAPALIPPYAARILEVLVKKLGASPPPVWLLSGSLGGNWLLARWTVQVPRNGFFFGIVSSPHMGMSIAATAPNKETAPKYEKAAPQKKTPSN